MSDALVLRSSDGIAPRARIPLAWDSETALFRPGVMAPELACVQWQRADEPTAHVAPHTEAEPLLRAWLECRDLVHTGANIAYDMAVVGANYPHLLPAIFAAYDDDRVTDVQTRQRLLDIAAGKFQGYVGPKGVWIKPTYALDDLSQKFGFGALEKGIVIDPKGGRHTNWHATRYGYGLLIGVPFADWPTHTIEYARRDAEVTLGVHMLQERHAEYLPTQFHEARAAFALHLVSAWGLRTHSEAVERLRAQTQRELDAVRTELVTWGLVRADGSRDTKKACAAMYEACKTEDKPLRLTEAGAVALEDLLRAGKTKEEAEYAVAASGKGVSLDADACEACGHELLESYAAYTTLQAVLSKDIPMLLTGVFHPVHTRFGMAASGRSTSSKPNVQNPRRLPGVREAFRPRPGMVYAQADVEGLELISLAQCCLSILGYSELGKALNAGIDVHTEFASAVYGCTYEDGVKLRKVEKAIAVPEGTPFDVWSAMKPFTACRDMAKCGNFGFPGGLGIAKFVKFSKASYGVDLRAYLKTFDVKTPEDVARELKKFWTKRWPEMKDFFAYVSGLCEETGEAMIKLPGTGMLRGGCNYTAACNTHFQGLGAAAMKRALWLVVRACYVERESPMFGSRVVNFVHDELITETKDDARAHDVAHEQSRLIVAGCKEYFPDLRVSAPPVLMRMWSKEATEVKDENGRLVPWSVAA